MSLSSLKLIDKRRLYHNRLRARVLAKKDADFLVHYAATEVVERLGIINRSFDTVIDLYSAGPALSDMLKQIKKCSPPIQIRSVGLEGVNSIVCDDELVPLQDQSCDLIVSALTLQFANDLPGLLVQIRRALKKNGVFIGVMVGGTTLRELRDAFLTAEAMLNYTVETRVLPLIDVKEAGRLLQRAGFILPVADIDTLTVHYAGPLELMRDLRSMAATNCLQLRRKTFSAKAVFECACERYIHAHGYGDGGVKATFDLLTITGWAPTS